MQKLSIFITLLIIIFGNIQNKQNSFLGISTIEADTLVYAPAYINMVNGDTLTAALYHSPFDSIKAIINGRLSNENFSDSAKLFQRKIDSTSSNVNDWIYNYTKKIMEYSGNNLTLKSRAGLTFRINDSIASASTFDIKTDTTERLLKAAKDTINIYKPLKCSTDVVASTGHFDSVFIGTPTRSLTGVMDYGKFLMKITKIDTTAIVFNDSVSYTLLNNQVSIMVPMLLSTINTDTLIADGFNEYDTAFISIFPTNLIPTTEKTIRIPTKINNLHADVSAYLTNANINTSLIIQNSAAKNIIVLKQDVVTECGGGGCPRNYIIDTKLDTFSISYTK